MISALTMSGAPPLWLPWQAILAAAIILGILLGLGLYYLIDRVKVLTGHTYRDLRHAGWSAPNTTADRLRRDLTALIDEMTTRAGELDEDARAMQAAGDQQAANSLTTRCGMTYFLADRLRNLLEMP